jgi:quercetin dioxygenase-like cupin family protein
LSAQPVLIAVRSLATTPGNNFRFHFKRSNTMQGDPRSVVSHVVRNGEGKRFDLLGAHLVWKARGSDTEGTFTVAVQTLAPGEHIPAHKHAYPEVFFIASGELVFTISDGSRESQETVRQGDTVVVAADSYHAVVNARGTNATLLDIACFEHQQFFDDVEQASEKWAELTPEETMQQVGGIALRHTMEFRAPE